MSKRKVHIREIESMVDLYRDSVTGIAIVENGRTGNGHSPHPNIDRRGSVSGMKGLGYWKKEDRVVRDYDGDQHNIDGFCVTDEFDRIAADNCLCEACQERRCSEEENRRLAMIDAEDIGMEELEAAGEIFDRLK